MRARSNRLARSCAAAALALLLGACTLGPDGTPPTTPDPVQYGVASTPDRLAAAQGVAQYLEAGGAPLEDWWTRYRSPQLEALVAEGLANSPDLSAAGKRLEAAREQLRAQVGESLLPSVDVGTQADRQRALGMPNMAPPTALYNTFVGQLRAQYTFDLFGAARYANASLAERVNQQAYELEAARRALAANIVTGAVNAAALRVQVDLTQRQAELARLVARDAQRRFELGSASQQEALDADQTAANLEAALPRLRSQWRAMRHALAVLLGRTPDQAPPDLDYDSLAVPDRIPVSVPSALLANRPDIRAADATFRAAAADIGAATAQLLPRLSLSASLGRGGFNWSDAMSAATGSIWSIGAGLTQPIFHGGALLAQRGAALRSYEAAGEQYKQTVLAAFRNVADTLAALEADNEALAAAERSRQAAQTSYSNTARRVALGALPGYQGRASEQHFLDARLREIRYATDRMNDTAALFHAMGGGPATIEPPAP